MDWRPIETAKKAPLEQLVWAVPDMGEGWPTFAFWHRDHWCSPADGIVSPTHYLPITPPKEPQ